MSGAPYAAELAKLRGANPCADAKRWELTCRDAKSFVADWGEEAHRLGWTGNDLFALNSFAPLTRYSDMGLIWVLQGREVRELTTEYAQLGNTRFFRHEANGTPRWAIPNT
jgi:hypothetical protein